MTFGHDTERDLRSAAAFVNTLDSGAEGGDTLVTRADLVRFLDEQGWYGVRLGDKFYRVDNDLCVNSTTATS